MRCKVMQELLGHRVLARDGEAGTLTDVYFDDQHWAVRHLVVETPERKVLVSPACCSMERGIRLEIPCEEVGKSPDAAEAQTVADILQSSPRTRYNDPPSLGGPPNPALPDGSTEDRELRDMTMQRARQSHLRSSGEVVGFAIAAIDGEMGHVEDLVLDEEWTVAGLVIATGTWLTGKRVLLPPRVVLDVDFRNRCVRVGVRREELERSPRPS